MIAAEIVLCTVEWVAMEALLLVAAVECVWQVERGEFVRLLCEHVEEIVSDAVLFD